jgi:hypothetical protein
MSAEGQWQQPVGVEQRDSGSAQSGRLARQLRAMSQRWTPRFESAGMSALQRCVDPKRLIKRSR